MRKAGLGVSVKIIDVIVLSTEEVTKYSNPGKGPKDQYHLHFLQRWPAYQLYH